MLTQHTYFNLDAYANPATDLILNHTYYTPYSKRMLANRGDMVPTGEIPSLPKGDINDFWSCPKQLGTNSGDPEWVGNCGTDSGCGGYNNLWIIDRPKKQSWKSGKPSFTLKSEWSGIKVEGWSNQEGVQIYTCYWNPNGEVPLKSTQGGPASNGFVNSNGCIAIEYQDWNDGINQ
jgi:aldose 1-epimerase